MTIDQAIKTLELIYHAQTSARNADSLRAINIALIILIAFNNTLKEVSK